MGGTLSAIPLCIVEEHHEAFLFWNRAIAAGILARANNTLLHIDEHADMGTPILRGPMPAPETGVDGLSRFTYEQLNIGNFILPCVFTGIFGRIYWVRHARDGEAAISKRMYVRSYGGQRSLLLAAEASGRKTPAPRDAEQDRVYFSHTTLSVNDRLPPHRSTVLDIDLDYFSCEGVPRRTIQIEVTAREYRSFLKDRCHPLVSDHRVAAFLGAACLPAAPCLAQAGRRRFDFPGFGPGGSPLGRSEAQADRGRGKDPPEAESFGKSSAEDLKRREMPPPPVTGYTHSGSTAMPSL